MLKKIIYLIAMITILVLGTSTISLAGLEIKEGTKVIEKGEPLFMRLDAEKEIEYIKEQMKNN